MTVPHALAETITQSPTESGDALALRADALRAEAWAGEPFVRADEDPTVVLAPGTARRRALDDALVELSADRPEPSAAWKVRYALLLGLERTLSERPPRLASGTELRRHQVDALAGMLTELIAATQKNANGNGHVEEPVDEDDELEDELAPDLDDELPEPLPVEQDLGAVRRQPAQNAVCSAQESSVSDRSSIGAHRREAWCSVASLLTIG